MLYMHSSSYFKKKYEMFCEFSKICYKYYLFINYLMFSKDILCKFCFWSFNANAREYRQVQYHVASLKIKAARVTAVSDLTWFKWLGYVTLPYVHHHSVMYQALLRSYFRLGFTWWARNQACWVCYSGLWTWWLTTQPPFPSLNRVKTFK